MQRSEQFRQKETPNTHTAAASSQPFRRICCSFPIEEQKRTHVCQPHSAQKAGNDPDAESQSHVRLRHLSSGPFPTSPHLPKPFPAEEPV